MIEIIPDLLVVGVLFITLPLNWYVTWRLFSLYRGAKEIRVLRDRGIVSTALAIIVTIFALIFLNNGMATPILDITATRIITRTAMLTLAFPALFWLWIYRKS